MASALLELAHIVRLAGADYRARHRGHLSRDQLRALWAIEHCRTPTLGGHLYVCDQCGRREPRYHSCRNRHCPKCQGLASARWCEKRRAELLPVGYFHLVFTLPEELHPFLLWNPVRLYDVLFHSAWETLCTLGANPAYLGARCGCLALLHTWSQTLAYHPHLHCIVPGGGLSFENDSWISARRNFLAPVSALSRVFRAKFLSHLKHAYRARQLRLAPSHPSHGNPRAFQALVDALFQKRWMVYCKAPFAAPQRVLAYLARYTHRVAITNTRLLHADARRVTFSYRDYRHRARHSVMTLSTDEFLRRFLLHVLPSRFVRIRSYGFLSNRSRHRTLARCRDLMRRRQRAPTPQSAAVAHPRCPCGRGYLRPVALFASCLPPASRAPP